jgi:hypothetical protein
MGKLKDFIAGATPVTDRNGREIFPTNAAERKAIKNGAIVSSDAPRSGGGR